MGRNYYCEYCEKRFKDDVQIRKKHLLGLQHQKARKEHYLKYKCKFLLCIVLKTTHRFIIGLFILQRPKRSLPRRCPRNRASGINEAHASMACHAITATTHLSKLSSCVNTSIICTISNGRSNSPSNTTIS